METTQLRISGMSCEMCVQHVTKALQSVPGVQAAKVDLAAGRAEVQHDGATLPSLIEAVDEEGYQAQAA